MTLKNFLQKVKWIMYNGSLPFARQIIFPVERNDVLTSPTFSMIINLLFQSLISFTQTERVSKHA